MTMLPSGFLTFTSLYPGGMLGVDVGAGGDGAASGKGTAEGAAIGSPGVMLPAADGVVIVPLCDRWVGTMSGDLLI